MDKMYSSCARALVAGVALSGALAACGGNSGTESRTSEGLDGVGLAASLGALTGGDCTIEGAAGTTFGPVATDSTGAARITGVPDAEYPAVVVCTGGSYYDEATGQQVDLQSGEFIRSLIPDAATLSQLGGKVAVTPLTDLAAEVYLSLDPTTQNAETALGSFDSIRGAISPDLGDSGLALLTAPQVVNADSTSISGAGVDAEYAAYLAGFSTAAMESGMSVMELLAAMRADYQQGDDLLDDTAVMVNRLVSAANDYADANGDAAVKGSLAQDASGDGVIVLPANATRSGDTGGTGGTGPDDES